MKKPLIARANTRRLLWSLTCTVVAIGLLIGVAQAQIITAGPVSVGTASSDNPNNTVSVANGGTAYSSNGVAISTTGGAMGYVAGISGTGCTSGMVAISGTNCAWANATAVSIGISATGCSGGFTASLSGASCSWGGLIGISALGPAGGQISSGGSGCTSGAYLAVNTTGCTTSYLASASGTGDSNSGGYTVAPGITSGAAASGTGNATGAVAVSGTGDASSNNGVAIAPTGGEAEGSAASGIQCVTISALFDGEDAPDVCGGETVDPTDTAAITETRLEVDRTYVTRPLDCPPTSYCLAGRPPCPEIREGKTSRYKLVYRGYFFNRRGCEIPLRFGYHDDRADTGFGYQHLYQQGRWNDFKISVFQNTVYYGYGMKDEDSSTAVRYCRHYYTPGGSPMTGYVIVEYGEGYKGIITGYFRKGHRRCDIRNDA